MSYPISQIKSALLYPDGLPIILYGERGTGKMYLVSCMKEFCQNHLNEKGHIVLDVKRFLYMKSEQLKWKICLDMNIMVK